VSLEQNKENIVIPYLFCLSNLGAER